MKSIGSTLLVSGAFAAVLLVGIPREAAAGEKETTPVMVDKMDYKEMVPGVSKAVLWGNPDTGAYCAITKFKAGTKNPLHTHSSDLHIVVLEGAYVYKIDGVEKKAGKGSHVTMAGGTKHESGADADTTFIETSDGKFDLNWIEKPAK